MKKMHIRIKTNGKTEIRVEGGQGDDCLAFTRSVEQALGAVDTRKLCARTLTRYAWMPGSRSPKRKASKSCRMGTLARPSRSAAAEREGGG